MKRALITGAAGFVGANLARRLVREGHQVHTIVSPRSNTWRLEELRGRAAMHRVDLCDSHQVCEAIETIRPDWVFHLAAHGAYSWQTNSAAIFQANLMGTIHLVEACRAVGIEALVHAGSSSEYGWKDHPPTEETWLEPNSCYAVSKSAATLYCRHMALATGMRLCTLRLYSVYGPYEEPARLMPTLLMHAQQGGYPPLVSPGVARDYLYIDDCLDAFLLAAADEHLPAGAVYNVGTGVQTTLAELVDVVRELFGVPAAPVWGSMANRCWDTETWVSDSRRLQQDLGWHRKTTLRQGLMNLHDWLHQPRWQELYQHVLRRCA